MFHNNSNNKQSASAPSSPVRGIAAATGEKDDDDAAAAEDHHFGASSLTTAVSLRARSKSPFAGLRRRKKPVATATTKAEASVALSLFSSSSSSSPPVAVAAARDDVVDGSDYQHSAGPHRPKSKAQQSSDPTLPNKKNSTNDKNHSHQQSNRIGKVLAHAIGKKRTTPGRPRDKPTSENDSTSEHERQNELTDRVRVNDSNDPAHAPPPSKRSVPGVSVLTTTESDAGEHHPLPGDSFTSITTAPGHPGYHSHRVVVDVDDDDETLPTSSKTTTTKTIVVSPWVSFLTADATIILLLSIVLSISLTRKHWNEMSPVADRTAGIPLPVVLAWWLTAYWLGNVVRASHVKRIFLQTIRTGLGRKIAMEQGGEGGDAVEFPLPLVPTEVITEEYAQKCERKRHAFMLRFMKASLGGKPNVQFQQTTKLPRAITRLPTRAWTTLNNTRKRVLVWETTMDPTQDSGDIQSLLMQRLLKNQKYKRARRVSSIAQIAEPSSVPERETKHDQPGTPPPLADSLFSTTDSSIGRHRLSPEDADTLNDDFVIVPAMQLRGMDIFTTDEPQTQVAQHPWLIRNGLRDTPTVLINVVMHWANFLIYLQVRLYIYIYMCVCVCVERKHFQLENKERGNTTVANLALTVDTIDFVSHAL